MADPVLVDPARYDGHAAAAARLTRAAISWDNGQVRDDLEQLRDAES